MPAHQLMFGIKMKKILVGMHPRIGSGRAGKRKGLPEKGLQGFFYLRLYRFGIVLYLKTTVSRASVC